MIAGAAAERPPITPSPTAGTLTQYPGISAASPAQSWLNVLQPSLQGIQQGVQTQADVLGQGYQANIANLGVQSGLAQSQGAFQTLQNQLSQQYNTAGQNVWQQVANPNNPNSINNQIWQLTQSLFPQQIQQLYGSAAASGAMNTPGTQNALQALSAQQQQERLGQQAQNLQAGLQGLGYQQTGRELQAQAPLIQQQLAAQLSGIGEQGAQAYYQTLGQEAQNQQQAAGQIGQLLSSLGLLGGVPNFWTGG